MNDPASGVQQQLLPHMHLVSKSRYPVTGSLTMETAVDYLLSAPSVVRELQPMHWMFLDGPPDGTVMLTWQPLHHLGTNFASDGYVWVDAEQAFTTESRGYTVEMWLHRAGYHPPNENVATHCRRRYRLTPSKHQNPNLPPCDPSLWIIHYCKAPATDHIPANRIPIVPQIQNVLSQRRFLQSQGQLPRKEFMLHDRNSWPTINLPQQAQQGVPAPAAYQNAMQARQQQRAGFYPQQGQGLPGSAGPTPSKAPRAARGAAAPMAGGMNADMSLEDEEVSTGDFLDLLTPREISKMRYKQHHEWMEEVFASPYTNRQIVPVDLGLGRKGELESLTTGFFNAPSASSLANKDANERSGAEKIGSEKAEEFTDRVTRKVADMNAEIEKMKRRHARRMEKVGRTKLLKEAELKLRDAVTDPSDVGSEIWRLEGRRVPEGDGSASPIDHQEQKPKLKIDDVVRDLETAWGAKIIPAPTVTCVQKGGFQERVEVQIPEEPEINDTGMMDLDATMGDDSHVRDQFGSTVNSPYGGGQSTPFNGDEALAVADSSGTFNFDAGPDIPTSEPTNQETVPPIQGMDLDVEMSGVLNDSITAPANNEDAGDWVMVGNEGEKPSPPKEGNVPADGNQQGAAAAATPAPATTSAAAAVAASTSAPSPVTAAVISPPAPVSAPESAPAASAPAAATSTTAPTTTSAPAPVPTPATTQTPTPAVPQPAPTTAEAPTTTQPPTQTSTEPAPQSQPAQPEQPTTTSPPNPTPNAPAPATATEAIPPTTTTTAPAPDTNPTGDALASLDGNSNSNNNNNQTDQPSADVSVGGDAGLDLPDIENSAFGDAFHVSDTEREKEQAVEGENTGQQEGQVQGQGEGQGDGVGGIS